MDLHNQARAFRPQHGGHNQSFGEMDLLSYGAGANIAPPTAQRVDWYNQDAMNNSAVASSATYPCQTSTSTNSGSTRRDPKSPATLELKTPTDNPRILDSALSSSFLKHARQEGPTANACATCNASFQTNSGLESHAKDLRHCAFRCACNTFFGRLSSLARHINSNTGCGYHCELCDKTLPRIDKLYDHLRDGHKVSQKVLDKYKDNELGRANKASRPIKPTPAPPSILAPKSTPTGGFGSPWPPAGQINGMSGHHSMNMAPMSSNSINPVHLTSFSDPFAF